MKQNISKKRLKKRSKKAGSNALGPLKRLFGVNDENFEIYKQSLFAEDPTNRTLERTLWVLYDSRDDLTKLIGCDIKLRYNIEGKLLEITDKDLTKGRFIQGRIVSVEPRLGRNTLFKISVNVDNIGYDLRKSLEVNN